MWTKRLISVKILHKFINIKLTKSNHLTRCIHSTTPIFLKVHFERENSHAYNILANNPVYLTTLVPKSNFKIIETFELDSLQSTNWKNEPVEKVVEQLKVLSHAAKENNLQLSDPKFDKLVEAVLSKCRELTDQQLSDLLIALHRWPESESPNSHNFGDLWSALDDMCLERHKDWSLEQLLFFSDHWHKLNLVKQSEFVSRAMGRLTKAVGRLTPNQFVQTMFFVNLCRKPPDNIYDLQYKMSNCMDELTIDELAILSMAFFKTKTSIKEKSVLRRLIERVTEEAQSIHEISLCAILKVIRYSPHLEFIERIEYLMSRLTPEVDRLSLLSCVHFGLLGTNGQIFHPESLQKISLKFANNIQSARLKDIERIIFTLSMFDFNPPEIDIYQLALKEIYTRNEEIQKYPRCFYSCLHFLSLRQIYPLDLIEKALSPEFITHTFDDMYKVGREIFHLDLSLDIEVPEYQGPHLNSKTRLGVAKRYTHWVPSTDYKMSMADKQMFQIMQLIEKIVGGKQFMNVDHVVPNYERADIIIALDQKKIPIKIENIFEDYILSDIKKVPSNFQDGGNIRWIAIVVVGWNGVSRNQNKPLGINICKLRQLKKLGYEPILISWFDWIRLAENNKEIFLRNKLGL